MQRFVAVVVAALALAAPAVAVAADPPGLVYRDYPGLGPRFQPLLSFGKLNAAVSAHDANGARLLADALVGHAVRRGDALIWTYDFPFGGSAPGWTSGFTQVVAAQALARTWELVGDPAYRTAADAAFRGLRPSLLIRIAGGTWVREYSFSGQVILNAQLQSVLSAESYAQVVGTRAARRFAADLERTARVLLPRFDMGCWGRYQLGGAAADLHYETYHVDLLRRLAVRHGNKPVWRDTYVRWRRCLTR